MRNIIIAVFSTIFLVACDSENLPKTQIITGSAQGTTYSVKYWTESKKDTQALSQKIDNELNRIDKLMSNYRDDSDIEYFNQNNTINSPIAVNKEVIALMKRAKKVHKQSQQCFDPTIKPLFALWGFRKDKLSVPTKEKIADTKKIIGYNKILIGDDNVTKSVAGVTVDLSAIGQGYAVSKVADKLIAEGITNYIVEIGGEMLVSGKKANGNQWRIGVERPVPNSQQVNEVISITGTRPTAVMTSGTYRHFFDDKGKKYSHILDPRTGKPVEHQTVAVTVIVEDATKADAWSTALLCLGAKNGMSVANSTNIPAVFYDIDDSNTVKRMPSKAVSEQSEFWSIK
ncbi:MAG: FAD:protein FMN transferase [Gammaproteobacteria bacterium]|nr:FAD:protein FMN transferase [Gammaproteobacteria bacterium]